MAEERLKARGVYGFYGASRRGDDIVLYDAEKKPVWTLPMLRQQVQKKTEEPYLSLSDFILEGWQRIDLTSLGMVSSLSFSMDSSDKGDFGINTPTYFALDDLTVTAVPEPGTAALLTLGVVILAAGVSRRR